MDFRYLLLLLLLSPSLLSEASRDLMLPSRQRHVSLAEALDVSPSSLVPDYSSRRQAIGFNVNDLFTFCWKDTLPRKRVNGTAFTGACRFFKDGSLYYCYEPCAAPRYKPFGATCTWSCGQSKKVDCGVGCADNKQICRNMLAKQTITTGLWLGNFIVPGLGATSKITKYIGKTTINATSPTNISITPGDMTNILISTFDSRGRVAAYFAAYQTLMQNDPNKAIPIQFALNLAGRMMQAASKYGVLVNIEDITKVDPTGTLNVLMTWFHPRCSVADCVDCSLVYRVCQNPRSCRKGVCGPESDKPDGTACVIGDSTGNTLPGLCQAGQCNVTVVKYYIDKQQRDHIFYPDGRGIITKLESHVNINAQLYATVGVDKVTQLAYNVWNNVSRDSYSCMFFNGGCGTLPCVIDSQTQAKTCVDVSALGYQPGPYAVDYTFIPNLEVLEGKTTPVDCMKACTDRGSNCTMVVTTQAGDCILKSEKYGGPGNLSIAPFYQAYIKV